MNSKSSPNTVSYNMILYPSLFGFWSKIFIYHALHLYSPTPTWFGNFLTATAVLVITFHLHQKHF